MSKRGDRNSGAGGYSYPTSSSDYGYPDAQQSDDGSLQPKNLIWAKYKKGKIGRADGGYYNCANWLWRVLAGLIDYGPLILLNYGATQLGINLAPGIGAEMANLMSYLVLGLTLLLLGFNSVYLQGMTGQSIGKKVLGMQVVRGVTINGTDDRLVRPGVVWALIREVAHIFDAICYVGFFAPLWSRRRQTFADMVANTVVLREPRPIELAFAPPGARRKTM